MSKEFIVGAGLFGAGMLVARLWSGSKQAADQELSVDEAKVKVDVDELNVAGAAAVAGMVSEGAAGLTDLNGTPVEGSQTGSPVVAYSGPSGEPGLVVRDDLSPGGTDPSATPATASPPFVPSGFTGGRSEDIAAIQPDCKEPVDVQGVWAGALFGPGGENGLTPSQISKAYALSGPLAGEIF